MTQSDLLDRLARLAGISEGYNDIWGTYRPTSDATRRTLLAAMGLAVDGEPALRAAIAELEEAPWRHALPPMHVVRGPDHRPHVPLIVDADQAGGTWTWRVTSESGALHEGRVTPAELAESARRDVGQRTRIRYTLDLPLDPGLGYHRVEAWPEAGGESAAGWLAVCPDQCYVPPALGDGHRVWALAVQLYALRAEDDWGMGDFTQLAELPATCQELGAAGIGLNPLHALAPADPAHCAPYSPSSRLFLNILYIDPRAVPEFSESRRARALVDAPEFRDALQAVRADDEVDYPAVARLKRPVLEALFESFRRRHLDRGTARARAFEDFRREQGEALHRHATFEALQERFAAGEDAGDPAQWPAAFRDPDSPEVAAFQRDHAERVAFFGYLQWLADEQLAHAAWRARDAGLALGLYRDLAVSVGPDGAEAWANDGLYARGARVGSPPDDFNLRGQDWGLPPMVPRYLVASAYGPFIATLRSNMRHAGALRIDHAMGLFRLFWVPAGERPDTGAYVHYPLEDLLGLLALESRRNRCMVIGEDLGTVPDEVRAAFGPAAVHSYRVLYFEKHADGTFRAPAEYPAQALATIGTHDLPPLHGFWTEHDLHLRAELDLFPSESLHAAQVEQRAHDRTALLAALEREDLLPTGCPVDGDAVPYPDAELRRAVHRYLARAPCRIMMVQPEDVTGQRDQANLPGTTEGHPNWRRRYGLSVEAMATDPEFRATAASLAREGRGRAPEPPVPAPAAAAAPRATYRLQLGPEFTLRDAGALVPYLDALGVSHCYLSPILRARPGSHHGYDVVDHGAINPEIGDRADFAALADALHARGMGLIVDIVPNHMGVMGDDNAWWLDVLAHGPASPYADYFDIDWQPATARLAGRLLLPVLGGHYGAILEAGELQLAFDAASGTFSVHYHEHRFPLDPATYPRLLRHWPDRLAEALGHDADALDEVSGLAAALEALPQRAETDPERRALRIRDAALHQRRLAALCAAHPGLGPHLAAVAGFHNGRAHEPASFESLHALLEQQAWRLAHWQVAGDEINYRRFFDINDLAGLRVERKAVFEDTHRLLFELRAEGRLDGVRVDHPDGLHDPRGYLARLARRLESVAPEGAAPAYRVIEKILAADESLPPAWPVHGTTGYDFANRAGRLFVAPAGERDLTAAYHRFVGHRVDFEDECYRARRLIMRRHLAAELGMLANRLNRLAERDWNTRDFTLNGLRAALAEVIAQFPVYRTYVEPTRVAPVDRARLEQALAATAAAGRVDPEVLGFLRDVLLLRAGSPVADAFRPELADFVMRLQQYLAAVMAKGIEDTAFYRYHRLVSLNEVGGDPRDFGVSPGALHTALADAARHRPHAMLATATHDAKRGEDVRARIHALSESAGEWRAAVTEWHRLNRPLRVRVGERHAPGPNDEYLLYQTLAGAWPAADPDVPDAAFVGRIQVYMRKAAREAKRDTSWWRPDAAYEAALDTFVEAVLRHDAFLAAFAPLRRRIARLGATNALAQCLLKLTGPGVPDLYQGAELHDLALVDPDNRRPVDFSRRRSLLDGVTGALTQETIAEMAADPGDARAKLLVTARALAQRRAAPLLFRDGDYVPLAIQGTHAGHVFAFARRHGSEVAITVVPRLTGALTDGGRHPPTGTCWADTTIELPFALSATPCDAISGHAPAAGNGRLAVADVLHVFPVALLHAQGQQ